MNTNYLEKCATILENLIVYFIVFFIPSYISVALKYQKTDWHHIAVVL